VATDNLGGTSATGPAAASAQNGILAPGDANGDYAVDTIDFDILAANFGGSGKTWYQGDFNNDGIVDTLDFNALAANFGLSLPAASAIASANSASELGPPKPGERFPSSGLFGQTPIGALWDELDGRQSLTTL
jgi:hypothetical protein